MRVDGSYGNGWELCGRRGAMRAEGHADGGGSNTVAAWITAFLPCGWEGWEGMGAMGMDGSHADGGGLCGRRGPMRTEGAATLLLGIPAG